MSQSKVNIQEGFLCPQCHQNMPNTEILHAHFQNVHMKQSSTTVKGISWFCPVFLFRREILNWLFDISSQVYFPWQNKKSKVFKIILKLLMNHKNPMLNIFHSIQMIIIRNNIIWDMHVHIMNTLKVYVKINLIKYTPWQNEFYFELNY